MLIMYFFIRIILLLSVKFVICINYVEQLNTWPVPVESFVNFTINKSYNDKSELLIKVVSKEGDLLTHKNVRVMKKSYVDLSTDYFVIKKEKILHNSARFSLLISFYKKSYGEYLMIDWLEIGELFGPNEPLYKERISLTKPWRIDIKVQVLEYGQDKKQIYIDDPRYFQPGKKVRVSCTASDGLPKSKIYVDETLTKRFRDVSYDEALNQWIGYLTLAVGYHNHSITCRVHGSIQFKSYNIIVNHPTTALKLNPEYNGYTKNGSTITCQPQDGFPTPIIKWDFVSVKNHSNPRLLYEITNDELHILPTVPLGTEMEFNCSAFYTHPLEGKISTVVRRFGFVVGEKPNSINTLLYNTHQPMTNQFSGYARLNIAAIGASLAGVIIMVIAVTIVIMLCRSKPKPTRSSSNQQPGSPTYAGSLLAGSKTALRSQVKSSNGSGVACMPPDSSTTDNTDNNELNYDDMPRGRRPIKVVDDPVIYSTIVGTMQPKYRPSLDLGPIDRV